MPYKSEKIPLNKIKGLDRRIKYTEEVKALIVADWKNGKSKHQISREYGISRKYITCLVDPERAEIFGKASAEYSKTHRKRGAEWAETIKDHRHWKEKLRKEGKIHERTIN